MPLPLADYFEARFEARPPLLRGRVGRPLSEGEFTAAAELMLALARRHHCPFWLLDSRHDASIGSADDPALVIVQDNGDRVLKLKSEVKPTS